MLKETSPHKDDDEHIHGNHVYISYTGAAVLLSICVRDDFRDTQHCHRNYHGRLYCYAR